MTQAQTIDPQEASRTPRFVQFLRAAVAVKTKPVTEVNKYKPVIWFSKLPAGLSELRSPLLTPNWSEDDMRWLVVERVSEPPCPPAPDSCRPWLVDVPLDAPDSPPVLKPYESTAEDGTTVVNQVSEDAVSAFERYLTRDWHPWAKKTLVARTVKPVYQTLFAAYQELQGRSDAFDVFVGAGLFDSRADPSQRLHRHLAAFAAELGR
jgi:hypothetical protein